MDQKHQLPSGVIWEVFHLIARTPHPSGHEALLRETLKKLAENANLQVRCDAIGNLRIDRPAKAGAEQRPRILLQGHLDMVPQQRSGETFDFEQDAIPWQVEDGVISTGGRTTLGADDGIGVAAALAALLDENSTPCALAGVFTIEEETGLTGAQKIAPEFLEGDLLLNLDSEEEGIFYTGCAGGARLNGTFAWERRKLAPAERDRCCGVRIHLTHLHGGHSGCDIDKNYGNAILELLRFLARPEWSHLLWSALEGGNLDNALPRECLFFGAIPRTELAQLQAEAKSFAEALRQKLAGGDGIVCEVEEVALSETVWTNSVVPTLCDTFLGLPNGALAPYCDGVTVQTSSNLAAVSTSDGGVLHVKTSQRSLFDAEREALTLQMSKQLEAAGGVAEISSQYCAWTPLPDSENGLLREALKVYKKLFGRKPEVRIIHAGLECGLFARKNPRLSMLSFGPDVCNPHSPAEHLPIDSVERFQKFLLALLQTF